jgi:flagellin
MPIVVNSNSSASSASFNLSRANDSLRKSLERLSSGKRINNAGDDAGGMAVAYKLDSRVKRTGAIIQNTQNALSFLQVQDGAMETVGKVVNRMSELRVMAQDVTKNSSDIENYSKEFMELQSQLNQVKQQKFNGISLFAIQGHTLGNGGINGYDEGVYTPSDVTAQNYDKDTRTLFTSSSGQAADGSISLNVINLQFVLSIGSLSGVGVGADIDLGGFRNTPGAGGVNIGADGYITSITHVSVGQFTSVLEKIADMRAENGAEQNRVLNSLERLQTNMTNLEAAYGRIMDTDVAIESTRFARHNVLVQASAAMTAQANQLTNVALQLLG